MVDLLGEHRQCSSQGLWRRDGGLRQGVMAFLLTVNIGSFKVCFGALKGWWRWREPRE